MNRSPMPLVSLALAIAAIALMPSLPTESAIACCMGPAPSGGGGFGGGGIGNAGRDAGNAARGAVDSAVNGARPRITTEEAKEKQKNWVDKTIERINKGEIHIKNRENYTDEEIVEKLNKLAHNKIAEKYDVHEPDESLPADKVKKVSLEEALKMKAEADEKARQDFAKQQEAAAKAKAEHDAWVQAQWQAQQERAAKLKQAQAEAEKAKAEEYKEQMKKNPSLEDDKGFNRTTDPNPIEEGNKARTLPGKADTGQ